VLHRPIETARHDRRRQNVTFLGHIPPAGRRIGVGREPASAAVRRSSKPNFDAAALQFRDLPRVS
jgi:hypothetical protein